MSRDLVVESVRHAAQRGESLTLDALEVIDLHLELLRLYRARVEPQRLGSARFTTHLVGDISATLERHGYRRDVGPSATTEFTLQILRLTRAFEGEGDR